MAQSSEKMRRILVIIPAWNEAGSVGAVVRRVLQVLPEATALVVDDGSTDTTAAEADDAGATVVRLPYNLGIGGAVQTGFQYALARGFDVALQVDADGQHPPEEIPKLLDALARGDTDLILGSRFVEDTGYRAPLGRRLGIWLFARLLSLLCGQRLTDTTSGFRAANLPAIAHLAEMYACDYPEVESLVTLHRAGFKVAEVPVRMAARSGGKSSIDPVRGLYYIVKVILAALVDAVAKPIFTRQEVENLLRAGKEGGIKQ